MRFTWDLKKAASNLKKHGISFLEAASVFADPLAALIEDAVDPRLGTYVKLLEGVGLGLRVERVHKGAIARPRQVSGRRVGR